MSIRLLDRIAEPRAQAPRQAARIQIHGELLREPLDEDIQLLARTAEVLELAVLDLLLERAAEDGSSRDDLRLAAGDAFRLMRALPRPEDPLDAAALLLRAGSLAVLGDKGADAARYLVEAPWPALPLETSDWGDRTWATILDVWLRLIRKDGWSDRGNQGKSAGEIKGKSGTRGNLSAPF